MLLCHMTYSCVHVCVCMCTRTYVFPPTKEAAGHSVVKEQDHGGQVGVQVHSTRCLLKLEYTQSTVTMETNELQ